MEILLYIINSLFNQASLAKVIRTRNTKVTTNKIQSMITIKKLNHYLLRRLLPPLLRLLLLLLRRVNCPEAFRLGLREVDGDLERERERERDREVDLLRVLVDVDRRGEADRDLDLDLERERRRLLLPRVVLQTFDFEDDERRLPAIMRTS